VKLASGHVAAVTGAASGIGLALATALTERGLLVAMADVEEQRLEQARVEIESSLPQSVLSHTVLDVSDGNAVQSWADQVWTTAGRVDLVVNNAGVVGPRLPVWKQRVEDYEWVLRVNLWGVINGLRAYVPYLVRAGHGHILNTASVAAVATIRGGGNGPYAASKHAVVGLSEVLKEELSISAPGVGVSVLCPGPVATQIRNAARNRPTHLDPGLRTLGVGALPDFQHAVETITAAQAARCALDAIETNRFWALTNPGNAAEVRSRLDSMLADLPPASA
jgi:NAD(P)-dependent dehydrogenase (short-subunit alcohol dehydrogenase family)